MSKQYNYLDFMLVQDTANKSWAHWLVPSIKGGVINHGAIRINHSQLYEVRGKTGVAYVAYKQTDYKHQQIFRVNFASDADKRCCLAYMQQQIGKGFDYRGLVARLDFMHWLGNNPNRYFCTELLYHVFIRMGWHYNWQELAKHADTIKPTTMSLILSLASNTNNKHVQRLV
jgi:uncharacterized protein YycO